MDRYLPALRMLRELVLLCKKHLLPSARTNVLFLSDGRPSDASTGGVDERELPKLIAAELKALHADCRRLESVRLLGFGEADARVLREMADAMPQRLASFSLSSGRDGVTSLAQSVSTFSSSVAVSRTSSVSAIDGKCALRKVNLSITQRMQVYVLLLPRPRR